MIISKRISWGNIETENISTAVFDNITVTVWTSLMFPLTRLFGSPVLLHLGNFWNPSLTITVLHQHRGYSQQGHDHFL